MLLRLLHLAFALLLIGFVSSPAPAQDAVVAHGDDATSPTQVRLGFACMAGMQREVWLDGKRVGFTPVAIQVAPGRYWLTVSAESLVPTMQWIDVADRHGQIVRLVPEPVTRNNYAEVSERLMEVLQNGPPDPHLLLMAMHLCTDAGEAGALIEQARKVGFAEDPGAQLLIARMHLLRGEGDAALAAAEAGLKRMDRVALAWRVRAEALMALGDLDAALRSANQSMVVDSKCWRNLRIRARIHAALGNSTAERADAERAEEMYRFLVDPGATP